MKANLLSVTEAAARLGLRPCSVRKLIFERRIDVVRIGRKVSIPEDAIEKMVADGYSPALPDTR